MVPISRLVNKEKLLQFNISSFRISHILLNWNVLSKPMIFIDFHGFAGTKITDSGGPKSYRLCHLRCVRRFCTSFGPRQLAKAIRRADLPATNFPNRCLKICVCATVAWFDAQELQQLSNKFWLVSGKEHSCFFFYVFLRGLPTLPLDAWTPLGDAKMPTSAWWHQIENLYSKFG